MSNMTDNHAAKPLMKIGEAWQSPDGVHGWRLVGHLDGTPPNMTYTSLASPLSLRDAGAMIVDQFGEALGRLADA